MTDLWDQVMGIPLDVWMDARTLERFARVLYLRDNPPPLPPPSPEDTKVYAYGKVLVRTVRAMPYDRWERGR